MQASEPNPETEAHDQADFDAAVNRDGKIVLAWLGGIAIVAALLMSILALTQSSDRNTVTITSGAAPPSTRSKRAGSQSRIAGTSPRAPSTSSARTCR